MLGKQLASRRLLSRYLQQSSSLRSFSSTNNVAVAKSGRPWMTLGAGTVAVSAIVTSSYSFSEEQRRVRSLASDINIPNDRVRVFTGQEVVTESQELEKDILTLVNRHGEKRIRKQLTKRMLSIENSIQVQQDSEDEVISLGEIDPKNLSRETLNELLEAFQQGAQFDKESIDKLQQYLTSSPNR